MADGPGRRCNTRATLAPGLAASASAAAAAARTERTREVRPHATAGHEPEHDMAEAGTYQTDSDQAAWSPAQPAALAVISEKGHGR